MIKLKIAYNLEYEIKRVTETISKIDWFIENKYHYKNFSFPKTLDVEKLKDYTEAEIKSAVSSEYGEDVYKINEVYLNKNWDKVSNEIKDAFLKSGLAIHGEYTVIFTKYGTGGSYDGLNTIIINLTRSWQVGMLKTIIHEIIHLAIQKYIDEYKIGQWKKERIVDLFYIKNFPRRVSMNNVYNSINTDIIDQIFDDNFPNMQAVVEKSSEK